ncbi:hypothetical protein GOV08_02190 [Candidatus Woesearchaeota archaeon]|nr:hypothetical protein [Candidatus Woesearchaeota archaeon]
MRDPNFITSDDILGKDVVDTQGDVLGVIQKLHIDKRNKQILGITVDQGFMRPDLFIGLEHIAQFGVDTVFLNTYPKNKMKGMDVINSQGKKIGVVISLDFAGKNRLRAINVKKGVLKEPETIPIAKIKSIGHNIILKD